MTKREAILQAGAKLFAEHSYDSVSIRQIATEADVNSAMISYYFGGKIGLLREIFTRYMGLALTCVKESLIKTTSLDNMGMFTAREFLTRARANRNMFILGLREFNRGRKELSDLNEELRDKSWNYFSSTLDRLNISNTKTDDEIDMIYSAVIGMIFSDYLLGGGIYIDDDAHFESYTRIVTTILQKGTASLWA